MPRKKIETKKAEEIKVPKKESTKASSKTKKITSSTEKKATKTTSKSKSETTTKKSAKTKTTTSKSKTASKKVQSKSTTTKTKSTTKKPKINVVEYYDLPYRYNETIVKVLAQTPKTLFVYWDISDEDRENYKTQYGENFFETTKPVLIIYNDTLHYSFEVDINDFANCWYLHVNDSQSDYRIELGRRPISSNENFENNYIYITSSNKIESPNDRILFDQSQNMIYFRNVKTNQETEKPVSTLSFIRNMGKIYNIYDLYKEIYKNENVEDIYDLSNPSSTAQF